MIYIGLARYTEREINRIIDIKPDGVILGDILCNKRMFPFSGAEIDSYLNMFVQNGIRVIFQTPMYLTDRIFEKAISDIRYYDSKGLISGVIVQDVGAASKIRQVCPKLEIIWGRMGYARTPIINKSTISFYINSGVSGFECKNTIQYQVAKDLETTPYMVYGWPCYETINRECYYKFENNIFDSDCGCGCLKKDLMILGSEKDNKITIDGYVLGFKCSYDEEIVNAYTRDMNFIIYGDEIEEICQRICKLEAERT